MRELRTETEAIKVSLLERGRYGDKKKMINEF